MRHGPLAFLIMSDPGEIRFLKGAIWPDQYPTPQLPEVAFAGRSNVGKSSLINTLVGRKTLARISQTPGKTQLLQFYQVDSRFVIVDMPGYGYARAPEAVRRRWGPMVERYLSGRKTLCLIVVILDIRRIPSDQDLQLNTWLKERELPVCYVVTKVDKVARGRRSSHLNRIAETLEIHTEGLLAFSAKTREGRRPLWGRIMRAVEEYGQPVG